MLFSPLKPRTSSKAKQIKAEVPSSLFIPYDYHWDKETIITKNGELMQVLKIEGFSFETADDDVVDLKKMVRNSLFKSMAEGTMALWFHTFRKRQMVYPEGTQPPGFSRYVDEKWRMKHAKKSTFRNDLYITVIRKPETQGVAQIETMFKKIEATADKMAGDKQLIEMHKELKEAVYRLTATFRDYGARVLTTLDTPYGPMSEPLEFLSRIVNCGESQPMVVPSIDIAQYLPINRMYFGHRAIEIRTPTSTKYATIISIKEYAPHTAAGILDAFLQLPFEFIISQSFEFMNRQASLDAMKLQQRRMTQTNDLGISQVREIHAALDMTMSGHVSFGNHHLSITIVEDSLKGLEAATSMVIAELVNVGINPTRETLVLEQAYWANLPANFEFIGRKARINSLNIASFAPQHNYPSGKAVGNHWGPAVTILDTTSGTPYFFNFHLRDVGHTTIIGPTGAGKTVLMNFLCAQAQKFNCRMFLFDKDRGADIFVRAMGGKYSVIDPGQECYFNPLQLDDTMENRTFIAEWLRSLVTVNDEPFAAEEQDIIDRAIDGNYRLRKEDRVLRNIAPFFGLEGPGRLASRLKMWHSGGPYAKVFDNVNDAINFSESSNFGFEMGEVLASRVTLVPVLLYLFHRIQLALDGTPTMIVLDEAWALIDNPVFAGRIKQWLKTLRKLNGMVVFATQSVEDAVNSAISDTLIQQTATQIFLPNPKATEAYRKSFMLSEREFNLLKNTDPGTRYFLVKQGKDIVIARIDLSGMEEIIHVLSGRAETVSLLDRIREEVGDDPKVWLPVFYRRVKEM